MTPHRPALHARMALAVLVAGLLVGCAATTDLPTSSAGPTSTAAASDAAAASDPPSDGVLSRDDGWRADIDAMLAGRERIHPDPWYGMDRADWVAAADELKARIPSLNDDEALVELIRLAEMPTWSGRDGHTAIFPFMGDSGTHAYPIQSYPVSDGLLITAARAPYEGLVGSRIEAIAGHPIDEVLAQVEPLSSRDNPSNLRFMAPLYLRVSELLHGLGLIDAVGPATFSVIDPDGARRDVVVDPIPIADDFAWRVSATGHPPTGEPLWLQDRGAPLWWTLLEDSGTLYVQYHAVQSGVDRAAQQILDRVEEGGVERVVIDLRRNGGGNNTTFANLQRRLRDPAIDRPGRLIVLIGPQTFSAAANFATDLEQTTTAVFAGEPMGGSPNLFGDTRPVTLAQSGQTYRVAARYWERSTPDDPRITIEPDLEVQMSSADYLAGRDPVLDAVIKAYPPAN
jgi:Peptidase family S41